MSERTADSGKPATRVDDPLLSTSTRLSRYQSLEQQEDRPSIARFFVERLTERFVSPVENSPQETKHGFTTMALSCLLVETLESFWCGWPDSEGKSKKAFVQFFDRVEGFSAFRGHSAKFWKHVRCGILHQGETTGGWKVIRRGELFAEGSLTVNATVFHRRLRQEIVAYASLLESSPWEDARWQLFRQKMDALRRNCRKAQ